MRKIKKRLIIRATVLLFAACNLPKDLQPKEPGVS